MAQTIYALLGSFLFSAYIVYDVHLLIARTSFFFAVLSLDTLSAPASPLLPACWRSLLTLL